jgi:hypothetical protein
MYGGFDQVQRADPAIRCTCSKPVPAQLVDATPSHRNDFSKGGVYVLLSELSGVMFQNYLA